MNQGAVGARRQSRSEMRGVGIMPERQKSKLLEAAESEWPDLGHKYGRLGIPAVRAAVLAKKEPHLRRALEEPVEERRAEKRSGTQGRR